MFTGHSHIFKHLQDFLNLPIDTESILRIFGILYTNDFSVRVESADESNPPSKLSVCYPLVAMASHECSPNTNRFIVDHGNGFVKSIIAKRLIKKGEKITISYSDMILPSFIRRQQLLYVSAEHCSLNTGK